MCQRSLYKISIFRPQWQPCLSFRGDFPLTSVIIYIFWLFSHDAIVPPGCWGVRAQTKGQEQAKWLDLQLLPFGAALGPAWCRFPRGSREEQSGGRRESTPGGPALSPESSLQAATQPAHLGPASAPMDIT